MKVYAISDLHLSGMADKPMNVFGSGWEGHFEKIKADWESKVSDEDIVLIGGDTSWGMYPEEGMYDVKTLAPLKGHKVFIRGNHDYWWNGITRIRRSAPDGSFVFLQNDCVKIRAVRHRRIERVVVSRKRRFHRARQNALSREGRALPPLPSREVEKVRKDGDKLLALIHYPPFNVKKEDTLFTALFEENRVDKVVFGHLHGSAYFPLRTEKAGIEYYLTSCDRVRFQLVLIDET